jgi:outer membrane biosynthesis protein TonB
MNTNDERLRDVLRGADPAAGEPGLASEEVQAMRRAVLTAVPEPRRRWIPLAALAGSALAGLILALTLLAPDSEGPAAPPRQPARVAERPAPVPVPAPAEPVVAAVEPEKPRKTSRRKQRPEPAPVAVAEAAPEATPEPVPIAPEAVATIAAETRQIQFSTPGGTRIIWVLTSDEASR